MGTRRQYEGRVFAAGVLCGLLLGAIPASVLAWRYMHPAAVWSATQPPARAQASRDRAPRDQRTATRPDVDWGAGMAAPGSGTPPTRPSNGPATGAAPVGPLPTATSGTNDSLRGDVEELARRDLEIPVEGVRPEQLVRSFTDERSGGRAHEALDILAPRNTPVKAAEDGRIVKLFNSKQGGITIYQFDPGERYCYYYAHLERYAPNVAEGQQIKKGDVIGYVGTSGNAPPNTPHLHFAIFKLGPEKRWWEGTAIDPYDVLR
jgi:murein DD-endopeptidase MepM/ murein hydrolase activator NlpD